MSLVCGAPDPTLGVAVRVAAYLDCQGRSLGENGFQALAGGPLGSSALSGLVTIFIALIGYRFILGYVPTVRDGIGWSVRLGMVLALVTSWPAFQTLAYRVVIDGPAELAAVILPATGLPAERLDVRVQQAYDTIRLGRMDGPAATATPAPDVIGTPGGEAAPASQQIQFQAALPNTASLLVISTLGTTGVLKIAVGFMLAIAPLALMSLLFQATIGLFNGWVRSLLGAALAVLANTIVTALDLMLVESELGRLQAFHIGGLSSGMDPQALTTIVGLFTLASIIVMISAMRLAGAFKLTLTPVPILATAGHRLPDLALRSPGAARNGPIVAGALETEVPHRASIVREALVRSVQREQAALVETRQAQPPSRHTKIGEAAARQHHSGPGGPAGRRGLGMRRRSAARRDRKA